MGNIWPSVPPDLPAHLRDANNLQVAIETGTFQGRGAVALARVFPEVYTVELLPDVYEHAKRGHSDLTAVTFLQGSSPDVLNELAGRIPGAALFWLDAHGGMIYTPEGSREADREQEGDPSGDASECPLLEEIAAVNRFPAAERCCVLIDDARAFLAPLSNRRESDWPTLVEIIDALRELHDRYVTILGDVIISVPPDVKPVVDGWWRRIRAERSVQSSPSLP